jgi:hypothetical protein
MEWVSWIADEWEKTIIAQLPRSADVELSSSPRRGFNRRASGWYEGAAPTIDVVGSWIGQIGCVR